MSQILRYVGAPQEGSYRNPREFLKPGTTGSKPPDMPPQAILANGHRPTSNLKSVFIQIFPFDSLRQVTSLTYFCNSTERRKTFVSFAPYSATCIISASDDM